MSLTNEKFMLEQAKSKVTELKNHIEWLRNNDFHFDNDALEFIHNTFCALEDIEPKGGILNNE